jgi:uncharacterized protein
MKPNILIEIAYVTPSKQYLQALQVPDGSTIEQVVQLSGIVTLFPELALAGQKVGIFSKLKAMSDIVHHGDRIELYRPLTADPKERRRLKLKKSKN